MPSTPRLHISTISLPTFKDKLKAYDRVRDRLAPSKKSASSSSNLKDLDHARYTTIPAAVARRRQNGDETSPPELSNDTSTSTKKTSSRVSKAKETPPSTGPSPFLTKAELTVLVHWKLTHGTFRPALRNLIAQNDVAVVENVTRAGFALWPDVKASIKKLAELRGVGPATASLLLSVAYPEDAPFFSDELFCWAVADGSKAEVDWGRKIKYSVAEYLEVVEAVRAVDERLWGGGVVDGGGLGFGPEGRIGAVRCEKVAFVLGNGGWVDDEVEDGGDVNVGGGDDVEVERGEQEGSLESPAEDPVAGRKRKRSDTSKPAPKDDEGTSTTTKTKNNPTRRNPPRATRP